MTNAVLFLQAMNQADILAYSFGDYREGQILLFAVEDLILKIKNKHRTNFGENKIYSRNLP